MAIISFEKFSRGGQVERLSKAPDQLRAEIESGLPPEPEASFFDRASSVVERRGAEAADTIAGVDDDAGKGDIRRGFEAAAEVSGAVPELALEAMPEPVRMAARGIGEFVGKGFKALTDFIGSSPDLQRFVVENPDAAKVIEEIAGVGGAGGQIAGDILTVAAPAKAADLAITKTKNGIAGAIDDLKVAPQAIREAGKGGASKVSDILTPIDKATETVLNPTRIIPKENLKNIPIEKLVAQAESKGTKLDSYVKISKDAAVDYSKPTALVKAGEKGGEALTVIRNKMNKQGQIKQEALGAVGDKKVANIGQVRAEMRDLLRERVGVNLVIKDKRLKIENAPGRQSKVAFDPADNKLMGDAYRVLNKLGKNPTVRQIDDTVDALQDMLYKRKDLNAVPVNGQVEAVMKQITGKLNTAVKKVGGPQYSKANAKYAYYIDTFDKLNKALGPEGVRGAQLMKSLFSPAGEAPRRLFADIKKLTGVDLVEEATLAKFAMEAIGDARQASLLEEVIRGGSVTPIGFVEKAAKHLIKKSQDPVKKAKNVINDIPKP